METVEEFRRRVEQCPFACEHPLPENPKEICEIVKKDVEKRTGWVEDLYYYFREKYPEKEIILNAVQRDEQSARNCMKNEEKLYLMKLLGYTARLYESASKV
jgi:hypothetical protein